MSDVVLCVNIDHIATLRQARGGQEPDPIEGAIICEKSGADGITAHLREDRRHIQDSDIYALKNAVKGKFNLEMALSEDIIKLALKIAPHQITLVPEKRQELTTEGGLNVKFNFKAIREAVKRFHDIGSTVSLFIEPDNDSVSLSKEAESDFIEIHTGSYCNAVSEGDISREITRILEAARHAVGIGIKVNAGHGLNYSNVIPVLKAAGLEELNIGHSIISRAVFSGLSSAVREMKDIIIKS